VVVSIAEYERHFAPKRSLKELLLNPPDFTGVDFSRDDSPEREFEW
jgi:hypothetical protein